MTDPGPYVRFMISDSTLRVRRWDSGGNHSCCSSHCCSFSVLVAVLVIKSFDPLYISLFSLPCWLILSSCTEVLWSVGKRRKLRFVNARWCSPDELLRSHRKIFSNR